jgi:cobaltochelatase CobS
MPKIDIDLAAQIEDEFAALFGDVGKVEVSSQEPAEPEPVVELPDVEPHPAWASFAMFSEVFGGLPDGRRDIPVPQFTPDDWPEQARAMIPSLPSYWHHNLDVMYAVAVSLLGGDTTLLTGPTGSGKTSALSAFCATCCIPMWLTSCYEGMEDTALLGSTGLRADKETGANITQYNPSVLVQSLWYGGMAVLDEAFRGQLMPVQSLLEDKHTLVLSDADGLSEAERVVTGEDGKWFLFLTDNTTGTGDHTGNYNAQVQDVSSLDRITTTAHVDYNPPEVEVGILRKAVPSLPEKYATDMVLIAGEIRTSFLRNSVLQTMSMRALLSWARKWALTGDLRYAYRKAYADKLDPESRGVAAEVWHQVMACELD